MVLGLREAHGTPVLTTLADALRPRRLLLVLDNCEHLVAACAEVATMLLRACPHLQILATSREALGIAGEVVWRVPPLALPPITYALRAAATAAGVTAPARADEVTGAGGGEDGEGTLRLDRLERFEAVQLFLARARAARPDFALSAHNACAVVEVCRRLDGLPLTIELAAARLGALSAREIAARLDDRFRLLKTGNRAAPARHQTLRGVLDWSYTLLSPPEQALLRRLAVFAGGWTLAAAEAVCAGGMVRADEALDLLAGLEAKSLVVLADSSAGGSTAAGDGESRYGFLETVRQYADDHLAASGEREAIREAHAIYMAEVAERAATGLLGPAQRAWLDRLEAEHDNVRAALAWGTRVAVPSADAVRLAGALGQFWQLHGHLGEGRRWLARVLAGGCPSGGATGAPTPAGRGPVGTGVTQPAPALGPTKGHAGGGAESVCSARARAFNAAGLLAERQQEYVVAVDLLEEGLALYRALGDRRGSAEALNGLGWVAWDRGDHPRALALFQETLDVCQVLGDRRGSANALNNLARVYKYQGDAERASALYERSLALWKEVGEPWGLAMVLSNLGIEAYEQGDHMRALALHRESLALRRSLGDKLGVSWSLTNVAIVCVRLGRHERAVALFEESLALARQLGDKANVTDIVEGLAEVALARTWMERAARLFAAVEVLRAATGDPTSPAKRARYDRNVAAARAALGEDTFAAAWQAGQAMTAEETIAYAL